MVSKYNRACIPVSGLFAKALTGVNIRDLITNIGSAVGSAPAGGAGAPAGGAAEAAEGEWGGNLKAWIQGWF